jgi:hypothetical protein
MILADGAPPVLITTLSPNATLVDDSAVGKAVSYVKGHKPAVLWILGTGAYLFAKQRKLGLGLAGAGVALLVWEKRGSWS